MKKNIVILVLAFIAIIAVMRNGEHYRQMVRAQEELERANAECQAWYDLMEVKNAIVYDYEDQLNSITGNAEYSDSTLYDKEIVAVHNLQVAVYGCSEYDIDGEYAE